MHIKSLKIFCDVVSRRSFSQAAGENGITQSGASQVVHQLEQRLGVQLIDRSRRPFVLTPEGKLYYRRCRKLVHDYDALEEEIRTFHDEVVGLVRVASIYSVGLSHMNEYVKWFLTANPKSNVRIEYQHPDRVYQLVKDDEVDLGLVSYPKSTREIKAITWRDEPMVVVCSPTHPLAEQRLTRIESLDGEKMVGFDEGLQIRQEIDRVLASYGVHMNTVMAFDNIETIKRAIEIGTGIGLLPEPTISREIEAGTLAKVELGSREQGANGHGSGNGDEASSRNALSRPLGIIHRRGKTLGATARRFINNLQESPWIEPLHGPVSSEPHVSHSGEVETSL